ncbi:F-box only protein 28-like [Stegodyphus dumicola]|uniref:F-box only protein 28-like n=1 Tax=Stegodyphus dumicola TaxID=202533 RepID=UPI0015B1EA5F|nr:F-box only protein 28-like [Stegodyphus dumicola]
MDSLPQEVIEHIISFLPYHDVSRCRLVCKRFNDASESILNSGFDKILSYCNQSLQELEANVKKEDERVDLWKELCEIVNEARTFLSMIDMYFRKYVWFKLCCFIPGKIIDKFYALMWIVMIANDAVGGRECLEEGRALVYGCIRYCCKHVFPPFIPKINEAPKKVITVKMPNGNFFLI